MGYTRSVKFHKCKSCGCHRSPMETVHKTYDRLTVLHEYSLYRLSSNGRYHKYYMCLCRCSCGNYKEIFKNTVISNTKHHSCGCITSEVNSRVQFKHGESGTRFYDIYAHMCRRCLNPQDTAYLRYGGRGITVCDYWKENFLNFKSDMYESYLKHVEEFGEKDTTLDRIDVNGNYELSNVRWATRVEQARNTRRNFYIEYHGFIVTLPDFCDCFSINYSQVYKYLRTHKKKDFYENLLDKYLDMKEM